MKKEKKDAATLPVPAGYAGYAMLKGGDELVKFGDNSDLVIDRDLEATPVVCINHEDPIEFIPRGSGNNLPYEILKMVASNVTIGSNVEHKCKIILGDGIIVYRKKRVNGKIEKEELLEEDCPEVFQWIEDNDYQMVRADIANDLFIYYESFVKYYFSREDKPKLVQVRCLETACSRVSKLNEKTGNSEWHGYSAEWYKGTPADAVATPLLNRHCSLRDLRERMGQLSNSDGKIVLGEDRMFVHNLGINSPGRFYYRRPYWWSVFASGWYDFSSAIPIYKKALIKNQMALRYLVYIKETFWDKLYRSQNITKETDKVKARETFLKEMEDFLAGEENAGKSFVSEFRYDKIKGYEDKDIIIVQLDNKQLSGGEYIEDSEEVSNTLCYGMGVHTSVIGASPGKSKSINGTEARELFLIEQALMKHYQDLTLEPLYVAKKLNDWPKDIYFGVVNCQLTTLDKGSGAVKNKGLKPETEE